MNIFKTDIAIIGGGIAGLWALNRFSNMGFGCVLIENDVLGGRQTLASQGMIHGGQKYAFFKTNKKSLVESIASMPNIWHESIKGVGETDLTNANILSHNQYMWSSGRLSETAAFFASKSLNAKVELVKNIDNLPEIFKRSQSSYGKVYIMNEAVLDIKSVISALKKPLDDFIYKADIKEIKIENDKVDYILLKDDKNEAILKASCFIFTAGAGNEKIAELLNLRKRITQTRPLKQIMVKNVPFPLYGHCITINPKPRVTITAHPLENEEGYVWYLGGLVAEYGATKTDNDAILNAYKEMRDIFPNIDWSGLSWGSVNIDRAEPHNDKNFMPNNPAIFIMNNACIAWPVKMTFAPALFYKLIRWIKDSDIPKSGEKEKLPFFKAEIGKYPWEKVMKWKKIDEIR